MDKPKGMRETLRIARAAAEAAKEQGAIGDPDVDPEEQDEDADR